MKIAVTGLGRMGSQIARKLAQDGHEVIAHNRSHGPIDEAAKYGAKPAYDKQSVVDQFNGEPAILWIMLPTEIIDSEIDSWLAILPKNSIIIDGGNSDYREDKQRSDKIRLSGNRYLDIGVSGGVWGIDNGFSIMVGGNEDSYKTIIPILESLSKSNGGYKYFGGTGSGHYVKMVHNAIEYGMMESLAEGYRMLKDGPYDNINLADAGDVWQKSSVVTSWINDLTRQIVHDNPNLDNIDGVVAETGETRWSLETASRLGFDLPAIRASFDVRIESQNGQKNYATKLLAAMRNKFGGHDINGR
jgi:6-phosphogluconate dehydrogenase